ncbi:hypothetical protein GPA27_28905 [Aromatoleum toluolicum]|uniref:hypothetical protein n=1 Tax=Aromatoleum toluolicum TaxID=90060 RepID=UPI00210CF32E|nr:hypothetical protein [Aromatoleum toluolicum]MCQ6963992.1 hypothetical protein [Aromatoleum toluolicum]
MANRTLDFVRLVAALVGDLGTSDAQALALRLRDKQGCGPEGNHEDDCAQGAGAQGGARTEQ